MIGARPPFSSQAIDYILAYDDHPDGKLDYEEFENLVKDLEAGTLRTEPLPQNRNLSKDEIEKHGGMAALNPVLLFASADADGSGSIDFEEFEKLHGIIVKETEQRTQAVLRAEADTEVAKAKTKRATRIAIAASALAILLLFLNAALTMGVVFLAKDLYVDTSGKQVISVARARARATRQHHACYYPALHL